MKIKFKIHHIDYTVRTRINHRNNKRLLLTALTVPIHPSCTLAWRHEST